MNNTWSYADSDFIDSSLVVSSNDQICNENCVAININMDVNRTFLILNTGEVHYFLATMGDKSVETLCHFRVLKANFFSNLYNTTPSPLLNVEFPVSRICLFLVLH